jgi:RND family efflux transporter MFP subunit
MAQQQAKVDQLKARVEGYRQQKRLTEKFLHPAERARARATLEAAEQELGLAREQLEACVMRAPASGMVAYHPLHIGTEYRTVRVGDTIFKNQPLITIPDMTDIVVDCQVPEAELSRVAPGAQVTVVPVAYPDLRLVGVVQTVSSVAQRMPDHPAWQKFFRVVIALEESESRLRSGMSVYAQVLSHHREDAVLVPRTAITWNGDQPTCRLRGLSGSELRTLELGKANTTHYEVLAGLEPGDRVLTP